MRTQDAQKRYRSLTLTHYSLKAKCWQEELPACGACRSQGVDTRPNRMTEDLPFSLCPAFPVPDCFCSLNPPLPRYQTRSRVPGVSTRASMGGRERRLPACSLGLGSGPGYRPARPCYWFHSVFSKYASLLPCSSAGVILCDVQPRESGTASLTGQCFPYRALKSAAYRYYISTPSLAHTSLLASRLGCTPTNDGSLWPPTMHLIRTCAKQTSDTTTNATNTQNSLCPKQSPHFRKRKLHPVSCSGPNS